VTVKMKIYIYFEGKRNRVRRAGDGSRRKKMESSTLERETKRSLIGEGSRNGLKRKT